MLDQRQIPIVPQNLEEKVVWYGITGTYLVYLTGTLYIVYPVLIWVLTAYTLLKLLVQTEETPEAERITIPWGVWVWIVSMGVMLIALVAGHLDFQLSTWLIFKGVFDQFARTWALMAVLPLVACLKIRPELVYRACCILGFQCLIFAVIGNVGSWLNLDGELYVSPLARFAGGIDAATVFLYMKDEFTDEFRLFMFAPYAPAIGVVGCIYFWLCCYEENLKWKVLGVLGSLAMVWFSGSRTGRVCMITIPFGIWMLVHIRRMSVQIASAVGCFIFGLYSAPILQAVKDYRTSLNNERAGSTRLRNVLKRIALQRWQEDAPIWGHGIPDRGNQFVRGKGIGSHGIWHGILFLHGIVGFLALVIPIVCSAFDLLLKIHHSKPARIGLGVLAVLSIYGFSENIESQIYLFWPGLLMMGIGLKEKIPVVVPTYATEAA